MQMLYGNHSNSNTTNCHDDVLDQVTQNNTVHSTEHGIKNSKERKNDSVEMCDIFRCNMKRNIWLNQIPGNKYFNEFTKTNKTISHETKTADQCKSNDHRM